jgi:hypothetical protein
MHALLAVMETFAHHALALVRYAMVVFANVQTHMHFVGQLIAHLASTIKYAMVLQAYAHALILPMHVELTANHAQALVRYAMVVFANVQTHMHFVGQMIAHLASTIKYAMVL